MSADPAAAKQLAEVLAPLDERDDLLETLDTWFGVDLDRRAAATSLLIHPNTLDYRLRRMSELIRRDLNSAVGTHLVGAALLARKLGR
ncbi:MAG: helix-turn-helix domain-containing protein [Euzebya sp.]